MQHRISQRRAASRAGKGQGSPSASTWRPLHTHPRARRRRGGDTRAARPHRGGGAGRSADRPPPGAGRARGRAALAVAEPRRGGPRPRGGRRQPSPGRADRRQPAQDRPPRRRVAGAAGALRPGVARPDPPQERAESAQSRRGARPRRAGAHQDAAHQPRARGRQGLRRRAAAVHGRGLPPQSGGAHPRRAAPGAAAAGGGDRRADRAHRGGRARGRGVVRGSPRDPGAAPGHRRGADHRTHVRADGRGSGALPEEPGGGAYLGLVPRQRESGERAPQLGIGKSGDAGLRRLLVQAAHYILGPFGPDTDLRRWGERYAGTGAGNAKKRAVVAVARRLAVLLLALWKTGEVYEPLRHATARGAA